MSDMQDWARKEIEIAIERERKDTPECECNCGEACYKSALKAYESLISDDHSGFSISITRSILNKLIDGKPLTPIEDTEDVWNLISQEGGVNMYQCSRMSSLFKYVIESDSGNTSIRYKDIDACYSTEEGEEAFYYSGLISKLYSEMFPIIMPYMPAAKPDIAVCKELLTDPKNGDFDTVAFLYIEKPSGERVEVNRYFKEADTEIGWKEISKTEFDERSRISITKN